jgi:hypothetical protein
MNERFVPSFQALRYEYTNADGSSISDYVDDIWNEISAKKNKNLVSNGSFKESGEDWILHRQLNGAADTAIVKDDKSNAMRVHVTKGGEYSYSVQLLHENIPVVAGGTYKFILTVWSDVEGIITARLGGYIYNDSTNGFQEHVNVTTTGQSYQKEFKAVRTDPFARLDLNLGKSERTIWIKDVQLIRIK